MQRDGRGCGVSIGGGLLEAVVACRNVGCAGRYDVQY